MTDGPVFQNWDEENVKLLGSLLSGALPDRLFLWITSDAKAYSPEEIPEEQLPILMKQLWNRVMSGTEVFAMDVPALTPLRGRGYADEYLTQALRVIGWYVLANQENLPLTMRERYEIKYMALQAKALSQGGDFDPAEMAQLIRLAETVAHLQQTGEFIDGTGQQH